MANTLEELVNSLYDMVQDAWAVPLGADKCVIEREKALDILDEIRETMPQDLKMARDIVERRNDVLSAGKREADAIKKQAEEYARTLVNENEIVAEARKKANEMIVAAETRARELKKAANEYCEDTMKRTEEVVAQALDEVRKSRQQFRQIAQSREARRCSKFKSKRCQAPVRGPDSAV